MMADPARRRHGRRTVRCMALDKTTVYLPADVKRALSRLAEARRVSQAELIRDALRNLTAEAPPPPPRLPLFKSGKPGLAERLDEAMRQPGSAAGKIRMAPDFDATPAEFEHYA